MKSWHNCKNILCIRADNMGDVIMSGPAICALKQTFGCTITLLTSAMGAIIVPYMPDIDDLIICDMPWVKNLSGNCKDMQVLIEKIKSRQFDAVVIFTVYSQSALPAAMLAYMAGIPNRLAYCRENPYQLLTNWLPDKEPYKAIHHQVLRDLMLVLSVGAKPTTDRLSVSYSETARYSVLQKLKQLGIDSSNHGFIIFHPGVSDKKREYPQALWRQLLTMISEDVSMPILLTGVESERAMCSTIADGVTNVFMLAGMLSIEEFIALVAMSALVVSVNTATVHIAAAVDTKVVVLYANTNPQHTPWKVPSKVLPFSISKEQKSNNQIIDDVNERLYNTYIPFPSPSEVCFEIKKLLID